ncbi:MAG: glycosyltransferase, partial [Longimicrobiales bacterium]
MDASVTAVLVTYRSRGTIRRALDHLAPACEQGLAECIVVDNASDDGTVDVVRDEFPWVRLYSSGGNIGYGRANNLALAITRTPYILFLNPDARIDVEQIARMLAFLNANPQAA